MRFFSPKFRIISLAILTLLVVLSCAPELAKEPSRYTVTQIGPTWGRETVTPEMLELDSAKGGPSDAFKRLAHSVALITVPRGLGGSTAFYLGKFDGFSIVATASHVADAMSECVKAKNCEFRFVMSKFKKPAQMEELLGQWEQIDLALFSVTLDKDLEDELETSAGPMKFASKVERGTPLLTMGFGSLHNPSIELRSNQDEDCLVFSEAGKYKLLRFPKDRHAWVFLHGCDSSPGDSGSPIVDRNTGELLGLITGSSATGDSRVIERGFMDSLRDESKIPEAWATLGYGVPIDKIREVVRGLLPQAAKKLEPLDLLKWTLTRSALNLN